MVPITVTEEEKAGHALWWVDPVIDYSVSMQYPSTCKFHPFYIQTHITHT